MVDVALKTRFGTNWIPAQKIVNHLWNATILSKFWKKVGIEGDSQENAPKLRNITSQVMANEWESGRSELSPAYEQQKQQEDERVREPRPTKNIFLNTCDLFDWAGDSRKQCTWERWAEGCGSVIMNQRWGNNCIEEAIIVLNPRSKLVC